MIDISGLPLVSWLLVSFLSGLVPGGIYGLIDAWLKRNRGKFTPALYFSLEFCAWTLCVWVFARFKGDALPVSVAGWMVGRCWTWFDDRIDGLKRRLRGRLKRRRVATAGGAA